MDHSSERKSRSQFALLTERRFAPFFWTQFFGAFNNNLLKNALIVLVTYQTATIGAPVTHAAATPEYLHDAVLQLRRGGR